MASSNTINFWADSKIAGHMCEILVRNVLTSVKGWDLSRRTSKYEHEVGLDGSKEKIKTDIILPEDEAFFEVKARTSDRLYSKMRKEDPSGALLNSSYHFSNDERIAANMPNGFAVIFGYDITTNSSINPNLSKDTINYALQISDVYIYHSNKNGKCIYPHGKENYVNTKCLLDSKYDSKFGGNIPEVLKLIRELKGKKLDISMSYMWEE